MKKVVVIVAATAVLFACKKESEEQPVQMSAVQFDLTDAPGNYDQVNIDLQQVRVKVKGAGWSDVTTNVGMYDLLQLTNGVDTTVVNDSVPAGIMQIIRLVLGNNNTIMVDSVVYPLQTPSAMQSGLQIQLNKALHPDSINRILLDFDAAESIVDHGNGTYSLKPVLRILP